jgi:hypothetical protein
MDKLGSTDLRKDQICGRIFSGNVFDVHSAEVQGSETLYTTCCLKSCPKFLFVKNEPITAHSMGGSAL